MWNDSPQGQSGLSVMVSYSWSATYPWGKLGFKFDISGLRNNFGGKRAEQPVPKSFCRTEYTARSLFQTALGRPSRSRLISAYQRVHYFLLTMLNNTKINKLLL